LEIWERLRDDPTAQVDLAVTYLGPLATWLAQRYPGVDPAIRETAAEDAIIGLSKNPATYDPARQTIEVYLRMSASGDLRNAVRDEQRHRLRQVDLAAVEHSPRAGKYLQDEDADPALILERREMVRARLAAVKADLASVQEGLTAVEVLFVELMEAGERKTVVYAQVLDLADRPIEEQRREVKRVKDRLIKRIERARKRDE
jgi:RNA polymerase sigma-70 factor (ECF subfamily)